MPPKPADTAQLERLEAALDKVAEEVRRDRELSTKRIKAHDDSIDASNRTASTAIRVAIVAVVFGILGLGVGVVGVVAALGADDAAAKAQAATDATEAQTTEARVASCHQYNDQQDRDAAGERAQIRFVFSRLFNDLNPAEQAELDAFYLEYDADVDARYPHRDCTPAGIEEYLTTSTTSPP